MLSSQQPPRLRAVIDGHGVLRVTGIPHRTGELVVDHDEPDNAYAELINLCLDTAEHIGGPVWLHADTPTGVWGMAVHVDGVTVPLPLEVFDTPDPAPASDDGELAALADALATAGAMSPPPADLVLALAADPAPTIRAAAVAELGTWADDPDTVATATLDATQLAALGDCRLGWVRAGVASHPGTDPLTQTRLAADPDPQVVQALAGRLDLTADLAVALVEHPEPLVRAELGRNPSSSFLRPAPRTADQAAQPVASGSVAVLTAPAVTSEDEPVPEIPPPADPPVASPPNAPTPVPTTPTSQNGRGRRPRRWLGAGVAVVGLVAAGATAAGALIDQPTTPAATPSSASDVPWQGTWLPSGPDGPTDPAAATATGFGHSPAGAALAATHLAVRIDPYAGPASFGPTILHQTYGGDPAALLARTKAAYTRAATAAGIRDDGPIPTSTGRITGWRIPDWTATGPVQTHLLVQSPTGDQLDYAITVAWVDGDYRLVDPTAADTFVTSQAADPTGYTPF